MWCFTSQGVRVFRDDLTGEERLLLHRSLYDGDTGRAVLVLSGGGSRGPDSAFHTAEGEVLLVGRAHQEAALAVWAPARGSRHPIMTLTLGEVEGKRDVRTRPRCACNRRGKIACAGAGDYSPHGPTCRLGC
jgi:hypothetical protein